MTSDQKVVNIFRCSSKQGVEALNRLTGLNWGRMPISLVNAHNKDGDQVEESDQNLGRVAGVAGK